jgi:hypothetical protein
MSNNEKLYMDFLDEIKPFEDITKMSICQLSKYKNHLILFTDEKQLTTEQNNKLQILMKDLFEVYDAKPADELYEKQKKLRRIQLNKFKNECYKINKETIEQSKNKLEEINLIIQEHKNKMKDKRKQYYKLDITCECGQELSRKNISAHRKTKKHLLDMELNNGKNIV